MAAVWLAAPAERSSASQLVDRNARDVSLRTDGSGEALLAYRVHGIVRRVLASGAINARAPREGASQVEFRLDYSGATASAFHGGCGTYTGPPLVDLVVACTAPDGSFWAVQEWRRELPDYGVDADARNSVRELRLSHWRGPIASLSVRTDWAWRRYDHLFGTLTYGGRAVFGFHSTPSGGPLDPFGRNVYIDTFDSAYGRGWRRENSALTHTGTGVFCYSFDPHGGRPAGRGARYRITAIGPGVTPDVAWEGPSPGRYNRVLDVRENARIAALGDRLCRPN
jgi:hypothetical protein